MFIRSAWSLHLVRYLHYVQIMSLLIRAFYSLHICPVIFYVLHAQYIPTVDAYSTLHPSIMWVQVLNIQITHKSAVDLYSAASVVNPHALRTIDMFSISIFYFRFSFDRVSSCPSNSSQLEAFSDMVLDSA